LQTITNNNLLYILVKPVDIEQKLTNTELKHVRYQLYYSQFLTELRSYRDLSGLLWYIVTVFVYVKCEVTRNMITQKG